MKAIIPVAGYGTRLRPHTNKIQKTLLPVAGKPVLNHIVEPLLTQGVEEIVFIVGHLGSQIVDHMKQYRGQFQFVNQTEQLGLGHAVLQGLDDNDSPVLVQLGDTIFHADYRSIAKSSVNRIAVMEVEDPYRFGIVETDGNRIVKFHEKVSNPPSNLAIIGLYFFPNERKLKNAIENLINRDIRTKGEYQLTDAMAMMLKNGEPFEYFRLDNWYDVGVPETFLSTNRKLLIPSHGGHPATIIKDPVHIGEGCRIENSTIGPNVTIMDHCTVINCTMEDSIVLDGSALQDQHIVSKIVGGNGSEYC